MALVDGFDLKFVSRTQSAERRLNGRLVDVIPVAWVSSWRNGPMPLVPLQVPSAAAPMPANNAKRKRSTKSVTKVVKKAPARDAFVEIRFPDREAMAALAPDAPFVVALALARPSGSSARGGAAEFRGVFEVAPTGVALSPTSIETRVIRRVVGGAEAPS